MTATAFPEFVLGRDDGFQQGLWVIERGSTQRGDASCNLTERILRIPLGTDETARIVRAHELMHVRVSPHQNLSIQFPDISPRSLECAEEFRVNELLARTGFTTTLLRDGTEKDGARRIGEAHDWPEALQFFLAVLGTGAERDFLAGLRKTQPTWLAPLRALRRRVTTMASHWSVGELSDTELESEVIPRGYHQVTVTLARLVDRASQSQIPFDAPSLTTFRRSLEPGARRAPSGVAATLRFQPSPSLVRVAPRASWRRARPSVSGTVMRYPSRLLIDEHRRAFATRRASKGGIVVIDQSGSMDIDPVELQTLVRRAPSAVVVGYSHIPGDRLATPNAWVLARDGVLASSFPTGHVGNGVDAPVLAWAVARARNGEPIVWVTDGQVTDSNDHPSEALTEQCAVLVRRHRIRLVRTLAGVSAALACHSPLVHSDFGRVGRKLLEFRGI